MPHAATPSKTSKTSKLKDKKAEVYIVREGDRSIFESEDIYLCLDYLRRKCRGKNAKLYRSGDGVLLAFQKLVKAPSYPEAVRVWR